jgi:tetratricopeptide (TPR) repeat protein
MIVKNGEASLPTCLASLADLVEEIVLVDTGSTDRTKEIAAEFGARVVDFEWTNSFADARNECLRHARGNWILSIDADEYVDERNRAKLRAVFENPPDENLAYVFAVRCPHAPGHGPPVISDQVRLFRNRPEHRWRYRVHEQILPALEESEARIQRTEIVFEHTGYQDAALTGGKIERNLNLLLLEHQEQPEDPYVLFNLGWTYLDLGRAAEALPILRGSLERAESSRNYLPLLYGLQVRCLQQLGQEDEALAMCQVGRARVPEDGGLLFQEGLLRARRGDAGGAEACFRELVRSPLCVVRNIRLLSRAEGLHGYLARYHLALALSDQGRVTEAETEWRAALEEQPDFIPAEIELAKLFLAQENREKEAEKALRDVLEQDAGQLDCRRNLARLLRNQQRNADVVQICLSGRQFFPDDPELLRLQGLASYDLNDLAGAEACLVRWLETRSKADGSENQEREKLGMVRHVLALVYQQRGRLAEAEAQGLAMVAESA